MSSLDANINASPRGFFFGWYLPPAGLVLTLCYGLFLIYGFGQFLPAIIEETGWSRAEAGGVYGIIGAEVGLLGPLYGFIVSRFGSRVPMIAGSAMGALGLFLTSQSTTLVGYYLSVTLAGFGFGVYYFGPVSALANWFNKYRGLAMGIVIAGSGSAGLLLPALEWGISTYGWRDTMMMGGVITFLLCVPLSFLFRFKPEPFGYTVDGLPASNEQNDGESDDPQTDADISFKQLISLPAFWLVIGASSVLNLGFGGLLPHMVQYFKDVGIAESTSATAFGIYAVVAVAARIGGGALADRFDKRRVIAFGFLVLALGIIGSAFVTEVWHLAFFILLLGPGFSVAFVAVPAFIAELFGPRIFPIAFAVAILPGTLLTLFAPAFTGWIYDTMGTYQPAFFIFGGVTLLGIPLALITPPKLDLVKD